MIGIGLLIAVQAYYQSSLALARTGDRARALMVLESQAETLRAAGAAGFPKPGVHALPSETLRGLPGASGSLIVTRGPVEGLKLVSLRLEWPERTGPPGEARLAFAVSPRGMEP